MDKNIKDKHWNFHFLIEEFKKETDRAAVILSASLIDETITSLLKTYLVPIPNAKDDFFDGANSALSTFSAKIDMCYRLGIISSKFSRDLHLIRKIRNSFAHDVYGCDFENGSVKSRITELAKACSVMPVYEHFLEKKSKNVVEDTRGIFLFITSAIIFNFNLIIDKIRPLDANAIIEKELLYEDGLKLIEKMNEKDKA
ncbi:hypothetical protein [uncultured Maribacter sp.]|uniref:hypothetical protein n=1 Tax=uncultured Maribacter sp. TaxID=431308 RepID=UPI00261313F0|nr:hypothetical protein [uncultured Maribacter sp.]